jgi:hypothetical protein
MIKRGRKKKSGEDGNIYEGQTKENKDKLEVIDKIISMYPDLKKEKTNIIASIIGSKQVIPETNEKIVVEFTYMDKKYYRSKMGEIFDEKVELVGSWINDNGKYKYMFYEKDGDGDYIIETIDMNPYEIGKDEEEEENKKEIIIDIHEDREDLEDIEE